MILYEGTKEVSGNIFILFKNEHGQVIEMSFDKRTTDFILRHFELLTPSVSKNVEKSLKNALETESIVSIVPKEKK